tara:strand:- start:223 stop:816 length:594 start_codon:yes stop_codon:yes gene_type:complete
MISALILAAGESLRMGSKNKLLLQIGSELLITKFVKSVSESNTSEVIVVLGHEGKKIRSALKGQLLKFIDNPHYYEGMTSSIQFGVKSSSKESLGLMICLADMPFAETLDFNILIQAFLKFRRTEISPIVIPVFEGKRGNPVIFSKEFRDEILAHKGEGCKEIVKQHANFVKEVHMKNDNLLRDIDTPEDYNYYTKQ